MTTLAQHVSAASRSTLPTRLKHYAPHVLSILRAVSALIFLSHGTQKLLNFPPRTRPTGPDLLSLGGAAGLLEVTLGPLLFFGLFTRPVAFILSGEMAFAYWYSHFPRNIYPVLNNGDSAILYCFVFLYLVFAGGGVWSLDRLWRGVD